MNLEEILKQVEFAERLALGDFDLPEMKISLTEIIRALVERVKEAEEVIQSYEDWDTDCYDPEHNTLESENDHYQECGTKNYEFKQSFYEKKNAYLEKWTKGQVV